jgi:hypothetical protein
MSASASVKKPAPKRAAKIPGQKMPPEFFKVMDEMMAMHRRNRRKAEKDPSKR